MVRMTVGMLVLVLAAAVASCSDGDPYDSPAGPSGTPIPGGPTTVLIPVGGSIGPGFSPVTLTVPVGTTVTWGNNDSIQHTSVSDAPGWNLTLNGGATGSFRFNSAGTFTYHCDLHPSMRGTVSVQ